MKAIIGVGILAALLALVEAWPRLYDNSYAWTLSRRSQCGRQNEKCYSSVQCCKGFVCAAFDDYLAARDDSLNPEVPGFCVREKDLEPCLGNSDCDEATTCIRLGHNGQRYCVPKPPSLDDEIEQQMPGPVRGQGKYKYATKEKGGLGAVCAGTSDCKAYTPDGKSKLCCQNIKRGRQGSRMQCDRQTDFSYCVGGRK